MIIISNQYETAGNVKAYAYFFNIRPIDSYHLVPFSALFLNNGVNSDVICRLILSTSSTEIHEGMF
jgi:hypothetical protein